MTGESNDGGANGGTPEGAAGRRWQAAARPDDRQATQSPPGDETGAAEADGVTGDREPSRSEAAVTGAAYGTLLVLGAIVGVYGAFYYSLSVWSVPLGAIVAVVVNFVLCRAASRVMRTRLSAVLPAVGWLAAVLLLSSKRSEGDLLITNTVGGYVLLFGGSLAAAIAVTMSVAERPGTSQRRRDSVATRG